MLHSHFKGRLFLPLFAIVLLTVLLFYLFPMLIFLGASKIPVFIYFAMAFFGFIWVWFVFGKLRWQAVRVSMNESTITVRSWLGWGKSRTYTLSDFDGFVIAIARSGWPESEFLYLLKGGKHCVTLSSYFLRNYEEFHRQLRQQCPDLGVKPFSQWKEFGEIFR